MSNSCLWVAAAASLLRLYSFFFGLCMRTLVWSDEPCFVFFGDSCGVAGVMAGLDRLLAGRGGKVEGSEQTETPGFTACSGSVTDDDDDDEGRRAPRSSSSSTARILVPTPKTQVAALQLLPVQEPLSSSSSYEEPRHIREGNGKKPCLVASKVKEPAFQGSSYDGQPQCTFPFYSQNPDTCAHGRLREEEAIQEGEGQGQDRRGVPLRRGEARGRRGRRDAGRHQRKDYDAPEATGPTPGWGVRQRRLGFAGRAGPLGQGGGKSHEDPNTRDGHNNDRKDKRMKSLPQLVSCVHEG
ncbi:hypothetical protein BHM03_00042083 [Ensete ventricosum]|nr:hypothetical protein BHM03_00042083 [Ensete ventricosum]